MQREEIRSYTFVPLRFWKQIFFAAFTVAGENTRQRGVETSTPV